MLVFTEEEYRFIAGALAVAAGTYLTDAHACDQANQPRTAEHFRGQVKRAMELAERITKEIG